MRMPLAKKKRPHRAKLSGSSEWRWSEYVTKTSDALDVEHKVLTVRSPRAIALSLRRSAVKSKRRHSTPFQSAMSMLTFYTNRAGRNLHADRRRTLEQAKGGAAQDIRTGPAFKENNAEGG